MDNLKLPAYPNGGTYHLGFSKLELASIMIAQGMASSDQYLTQSHAEHVAMANTAVSLAKAVIEEANK